MNKRRRLLMTGLKAVTGGWTECVTCGYSDAPDHIDGEYSRKQYIGYCRMCGNYTVQYHCETDCSQSGKCDIKWCSCCGYPAECPSCGNTSFSEEMRDYWSCGNHVPAFYVCNSCHYEIPVTFTDGQEDCPYCGGGGGGGDPTVGHDTCPTCHTGGATYTNTFGTCKTCGLVNLRQCVVGDCSTQFCNECGLFNPIFYCYEGEHYSWSEPDTMNTAETCSGCNLSNCQVYLCPICRRTYCTVCGTRVYSDI